MKLKVSYANPLMSVLALISMRVYRPAWTTEAAMDLLRRESGTAFDVRCVDALECVVTGVDK